MHAVLQIFFKFCVFYYVPYQIWYTLLTVNFEIAIYIFIYLSHFKIKKFRGKIYTRENDLHTKI